MSVYSSLSIDLIKRLKWQLAYKDELILQNYPGVRDYDDLMRYKNDLLRLILPLDSVVRKNEVIKSYVIYLMSEVNIVKEMSPVKDWLSQNGKLKNLSSQHWLTCKSIL